MQLLFYVQGAGNRVKREAVGVQDVQAVTTTDGALFDTWKAADGLSQMHEATAKAKTILEAGLRGDDLAAMYGAEAVLTDAMQMAERLTDDLGPLWGQVMDRIAALGGVGVEEWAEK